MVNVAVCVGLFYFVVIPDSVFTVKDLTHPVVVADTFSHSNLAWFLDYNLPT